MRTIAIAAALLLVAGCAGKDEPPPPPTYSTIPPPMETAPEPVPTDTRPKDACGAADMQRLVGRPRSEIPVPVNPNARRVTCTTCPVTMDYRADRLNIFFDADTGIIKEVKCG